MVTTRRRSALSEQPSPAPAASTRKHRNGAGGQKPRIRRTVQRNREDRMEVDDTSAMLSDDPDSDADSGSDWDGKGKKWRKAAKRAKRSHPSPGKSKGEFKGGRMGRCLSQLLTMPIDILYEIFSHLPAKDLVSLTLASKPLRETLSSRNAITVWKAARKVTGAPGPMPDYSEPRWAALLFSGTSCDECGTKGVQKIDFALRRRVCERCKKKNLVVLSKFRRNFEDYDEILLSFIPHTHVGGWAHGHKSKGKWWWESDIYAVAQEYGALRNNTHMLRISGARKRLEDWGTKRVKLVEEILAYADVCAAWHREYLAKRSQEYHDRSVSRRNAIYAKFRDMGYLDQDVDSLRWDNAVLQTTELNDRIWKRIRPILEPKIIAFRTERTLTQRKLIFTSLYDTYRKTLTPDTWLYQPRNDVVLQFPIFSTIVGAGYEVNVTSESFNEGMNNISELIEEWTEQRKSALRAQIPPADPSSAAASSSDPIPDALDLATSVFACPLREFCGNNRPPWNDRSSRFFYHSSSEENPAREKFPNPLFGWHDAGMHHTCETRENWSRVDKPSNLEIDEWGVAAVKSLIKLLGLPETVTIQEMDARNARVCCKGKGFQGPGGFKSTCGTGSDFTLVTRRQAHTWRSAVAHAMSNLHEEVPSFELLSDAEAAELDEQPDPICRDYAWACNHCVRNFNDWDLASRVKDHLKDVHSITDPQVPRDLFSSPFRRYNIVTLPTIGQSA